MKFIKKLLKYSTSKTSYNKHKLQWIFKWIKELNSTYHEISLIKE